MAGDGTSRRIPCIEINRAMIANRASCIIGSKGFSLVAAVADKQDLLRCQGKPVVFYSQELMAAIGTNNPVTFRRARDKAVAAGWLVFIPGSTRCPGQYLAKIPDGLSVPDYAADYVTHSDTYSDNYLNTYSDTKGNLIDTSIGICSQSLTLTLPIPNKIHPEITSGSAICETAKIGEVAKDEKKPRRHRKPIEYSPEFLSWWNVYPRQEAKGDAQKSFEKAIREISAQRKVDRSEAIEWLLLVTASYAKTPAGMAGKFTPHPSTWLNQKRYDDNTAEWSKTSTSAGITYDPAAGANDPTFGVF